MSNLKNLSVAAVGATFIGLGTVSTAQAAALGGQIFSTGGAPIKVELLPDQGGYTHELFLSILGDKPSNLGKPFSLQGSFPHDAELIFGIRVLDTGLSYETGPGSRNPDGIPHANVNFVNFNKNSSTNVAKVGFEDLFGGGDKDYNDFKFKVSGGIQPKPAPEPSSALGTLAFGALGAGYMLNRKLKKRRSASLDRV